MLNQIEIDLLGLCVEWFLYGLYSGIFTIYLQCPKKESRSATIVFYVLCLLYVLSTASVVGDLINFIIGIYINYALSSQSQFEMLSMEFRLQFVQATLNGCCDVVAQIILIYRCWIVWGKNIRVGIIPSFLAITFIVLWLVSESPVKMVLQAGNLGISTTAWGYTLTLTALVATMAVNTLVTGLIVFKILKVFLEVKTTSIDSEPERTLPVGSLSLAAENPKLQHIIFIIIESGMALFVIHLVRIVLSSLLAANASSVSGIDFASVFVIVSNQMLNGIAPTIILVRVSMGLSFDDQESLKEGAGSLHFNNPPSDANTPALLSSGSIVPAPGEE